MKILIVGNVFKDVYLNIDERVEKFETDSDGTRWLNLSFDTSEHRFFRRTSSFGGAAISLEVLSKMGLEAEICGSPIAFKKGEIHTNGNSVADIYRYILISDEQATYFAPSYEHATEFVMPNEHFDYIFIDRSANIADSEVILDYLDFLPETRLVVHARKNPRSKAEKELLRKADLVFAEREIGEIDAKKLVKIEPGKISYLNVVEKFKNPRENLMTHLSIYSILAATVLGGFVLGRSAEESLKLAKTNVEHSSLDACLDLATLEELAA